MKNKFSFVEVKDIQIEKGPVVGISIKLQNASLILIKANKGYVMCGYLNINAANKFGDIAGRVSGVKTFEDVLNASIQEFSETAIKMGFSIGMKARDFLNELI